MIKKGCFNIFTERWPNSLNLIWNDGSGSSKILKTHADRNDQNQQKIAFKKLIAKKSLEISRSKMQDQLLPM